MRRSKRMFLLGACLCAMGIVTGGSASGETLKVSGGSTGLFAFLGSPTQQLTVPLGVGSGKDFGIGENMVFEGGTALGIGSNVSFTFIGESKLCTDTRISGTVVSNTTGENNPIGFNIEALDFAKCTSGGTSAPWYSDTKDGAARARFKLGANGSAIEGLVIDWGGTLMRGSLEGTWTNGTAATPPCLKLSKIGTFGRDPGGTAPTAISGELCLVSANNDGPNNIILTNP